MSPPENGNIGTSYQVLGAIKSPMIFNALAILLAVQFGWIVRGSMITAFDWSVFGFIVIVTLWLNVFAAINPRFLAYGPREYLRESELAHERRMKGIAE